MNWEGEYKVKCPKCGHVWNFKGTMNRYLKDVQLCILNINLINYQ